MHLAEQLKPPPRTFPATHDPPSGLPFKFCRLNHGVNIYTSASRCIAAALCFLCAVNEGRYLTSAAGSVQDDDAAR